MMTRKLMHLCGCLVLAGALAGCGGGSGTLATVNGEPLSMEDFHNYLETKSNVRVLVGGQVAELPVADTLAFQAMQDMVSQKLLLQIAKEEKVAPTAAEVDEEIKFKQKLQPSYIQTLSQRGLTTKQIRQMQEVQLAQERVITKGITVTDAEVQETIRKDPTIFVEPAKAALELLFVTSPQRREEADRALRSGTGFTSVRGQFDQSPANLRAQFDGTRLSGDGMPIAALNEPFKAAVMSTSPGKITDWMKAGQGWAKLLVHRKTPKKDLEKTPERLAYLKRQIAVQKASRQIAEGLRTGRTDNSLPKRIGDKLRKSQIKIVEPSLKTPWERFEERLKAQADQTKVPDAK